MELTEEQKASLEKQDSRKCDPFRAEKFQKESLKHWDIFYKRNETRFFKDRHWTTREFQELVSSTDDKNDPLSPKVLLEVGCGVGNFVFPLLDLEDFPFKIFAVDLSPRAIEFVKQNPNYDEQKVTAFPCDISQENCFDEKLGDDSIDIVSMIFVLSAIRPSLFKTVMKNIFRVLKPGGLLIFRDYGVNDMAMLRFKGGSKIADRHYVRQDGTTTYFFTLEEMKVMIEECGFILQMNEYVERRTVNLKESVDVPRIFVQGKYRKE